LLSIVLFSCTAPRSVIHSGKVTPKGQFRVGTDFRGNISTSTASAMYDTINEGADTLQEIANGNQAKLTGEEGKQFLDKMVKALIIYSIDPISMGYDFRVRYGVAERMDIGYKYDSGVNVIDARFQFAGPTKKSAAPQFFSNLLGKKWDGSIGIQFSKQNFEIPVPGLDKIQDVLGYAFERYDILVPLALSYRLGKNESLGSIGMGLVTNLGKIRYGFDDERIAAIFENSLQDEGITVPVGDSVIHSLGGFVNAKLGYKWFYIIASLSVYYQNYGSYKLFGMSPYSFSGFTIVPTIGIVGQFM